MQNAKTIYLILFAAKFTNRQFFQCWVKRLEAVGAGKECVALCRNLKRFVLAYGEGFWLYAKNGGTLTISGQVLDTDTETRNLVAGLNMVASPWPMNVPLTKISVTGQPSFNESGDAQTTLRVWTGGGYTYYAWAGDLTGENPDMAEEIADELGVDPATLNNHWLNGDYEIADDEIEIGTSFWIYAKNSGTITFSK